MALRLAFASSQFCLDLKSTTSEGSRQSDLLSTFPIPSEPNDDLISYGPSFVPTTRAMCARNYSLWQQAQRMCTHAGRLVGKPPLSAGGRVPRNAGITTKVYASLISEATLFGQVDAAQ